MLSLLEYGRSTEPMLSLLEEPEVPDMLPGKGISGEPANFGVNHGEG